MSEADLRFAELSKEQVERVRALEAELGESVVILAYDKPLQPASLDEDQVAKLAELEMQLGSAYLVAYRKPRV
jgi:hypothetical protein